MRFKECGVLAFRISLLHSTVLQNALPLRKEMMRLGLVFFGSNRSWSILSCLPCWYFHVNICAYLFKMPSCCYPATLPTILLVSINNHNNKCIHWNIQNWKVKGTKFLKLLKSHFERSYRMEFESKKNVLSKSAINFRMGCYALMSDDTIPLVNLIPKAIALKVSLWHEYFPFKCVSHIKPQSQHCNFKRLSLMRKLEYASFPDIY